MNRIDRTLALAALLATTVAAPVLAATGSSISIAQPAAGAAFDGATIPVKVAVSNFQLECKDVGLPGKPGRGHIHAMVDGMSMEQMTNLYCSDSFEISGVGLRPGTHTLAVVLANDEHLNVGKPAMVKFDYEPAKPVGLPAPEQGAKPTVKILAPQNGAEVGRKFDLKVAVSGFDLSCDLEGKPDVAGHGHLHVFVNQGGAMHAINMDSTKDKMSTTDQGSMHGGSMSGMEGKSMAMPGMIGMPCATTVPVDLSAWKPGKTQLVVMLANNDHMPTAGTVPASTSVTVK
jgi:hypothetical protein